MATTGTNFRERQEPMGSFAYGDGMDWRERLQVDIALPCDVAMAPRAPQTYQGVTEQIGRENAVIRLDPRQPAAEWPRVGDVVTANCSLPVDGTSRYTTIQCRGTVTRVVLTESGAPRLEVRLDHLKFRSSGNGRKVKKAGNGNPDVM